MKYLVLILIPFLIACEEGSSPTVSNVGDDPSAVEDVFDGISKSRCATTNYAGTVYGDSDTRLYFGKDCLGEIISCGVTFEYRTQSRPEGSNFYPVQLVITSVNESSACTDFEVGDYYDDCGAFGYGGAGGVQTSGIELRCFNYDLDLQGIEYL